MTKEKDNDLLQAERLFEHIQNLVGLCEDLSVLLIAIGNKYGRDADFLFEAAWNAVGDDRVSFDDAWEISNKIFHTEGGIQ